MLPKNFSILLIISGGIAAYKALELIRLIRKAGGNVTCILTKGGEQFVTPLSVAALSENEVHTDLWSLKDEGDMRHIKLTRDADLIVIAPASADIMAKLATGIADDLATTTLLAADKPFIFAPAMNHKMWHHPATQQNVATLMARGNALVDPTEGDMACGEYGVGRMAEPEDILSAVQSYAENLNKKKALTGYKALVTSGPTYEPLDPVRFIGNRSSGKQGHAIAATLAHYGAEVTLVSGPVALPDPPNVRVIHVETAADMLDASQEALPADIAIFAAAVADWRSACLPDQKIKKNENGRPPSLTLLENPDILKAIANHQDRPRLVIGFAAETDNLLSAAKLKLKKKGCDWIVANQVGTNENPVFGQDQNAVILVTRTKEEAWPLMSKQLVAQKLVAEIINYFEDHHVTDIRTSHTSQ